MPSTRVTSVREVQREKHPCGRKPISAETRDSQEPKIPTTSPALLPALPVMTNWVEGTFTLFRPVSAKAWAPMTSTLSVSSSVSSAAHPRKASIPMDTRVPWEGTALSAVHP